MTIGSNRKRLVEQNLYYCYSCNLLILLALKNDGSDYIHIFCKTTNLGHILDFNVGPITSKKAELIP